MGIRGELFSTKVLLQNRTYFFNVKENRLGDLYLNIVESKNKDEGGFDRQSVILFAEDLQEFLKGFDESLRVLEKASREKRRGKSAQSGPRERDSESDRGNDRDNYRENNRESERDYNSGNREYRKTGDSRRSENPRRDRDFQSRGESRGEGRFNRTRNSDSQAPFRSRNKTKDFGPGKFESQNRTRSYKGRKDSERQPNNYRSESFSSRPPRDSDTRKKRVVVRKK